MTLPRQSLMANPMKTPARPAIRMIFGQNIVRVLSVFRGLVSIFPPLIPSFLRSLPLCGLILISSCVSPPGKASPLRPVDLTF